MNSILKFDSEIKEKKDVFNIFLSNLKDEKISYPYKDSYPYKEVSI